MEKKLNVEAINNQEQQVNPNGKAIKVLASAVKSLKGCKLNITPAREKALDKVMREVGLRDLDEALAFTAAFDERCTDDSLDIDDLSNWLSCSALEAMSYSAPLNEMMARGIVLREAGKSGLEASYKVSPEVFEGIVACHPVTPARPADGGRLTAADFARAIDWVVCESSYSARRILARVAELEVEAENLEIVKQARRVLPDDIVSRTLLYDVCFDVTTTKRGPDEGSCISSTLSDIFRQDMERFTLESQLKEGSHPLIQPGLVEVPSDDRMVLTETTAKWFCGEKAHHFVRSYRDLSILEVCAKVSNYIGEMSNHPGRSERKRLINLVKKIERQNPQLTGLQAVVNKIEDAEYRALFYRIAHDHIRNNHLSLSDLGEHFHLEQELMERRDFIDEKHVLLTSGLVRVEKAAVAEDGKLALTPGAIELFFADKASFVRSDSTSRDVILPSSIVEKRLFYPTDLERQINVIDNALRDDCYLTLRNRLKEKGMPLGVAILLYGAPGTGKTETVMQLARRTGRAVMHVDISATKTCWFGESEKLIKKVFDNYRTLCERSAVTPILLFNEADAVLGKRKDNTSSNVAQTENAIQNIILEQMEQLDGILVATTNLADNLDSAFERRFLFKVRYDKPTPEAKRLIWLDKMPTLSPEQALLLAATHDFSGGQIDNVVRKATMLEVIEGAEPDFATIERLCREEKLGKSSLRPSVGFVA
ncbi:MAG: AAA family ATPase [Bacteroidales bacterium]|nr:AAA family ATPase [Bacteroidales bacterium]